MPIRPAGHADVPHIVALLNRMHDESPVVRAFQFDPDIAMETIDNVLDAESDDVFMWIYIDAGKVQGLILMEAAPALFGAYTIVAEHLVYASPEARGSFGMGRLLQTALRWAEGKGDVIRFEASSGIEQDDLAKATFEKLGLRPSGTLYGKEMV